MSKAYVKDEAGCELRVEIGIEVVGQEVLQRRRTVRQLGILSARLQHKLGRGGTITRRNLIEGAKERLERLRTCCQNVVLRRFVVAP